MWPTALQRALDDITIEQPNLVPSHIGAIGYDGMEFMSVSTHHNDQVYAEHGVSLDWYRSYDATWSQPSRFFLDHADVDLEDLDLCTETYCMNAGYMGDYLEHTSDYDGVEMGSDGNLRCRCDGTGKWWLSPACRSNASRCIPLVTGGKGWGLDQFMQKATIFNMSMAIATLKRYEGATLQKYAGEFTTYAWQPDTTFLRDFTSKLVIFPEHKPEEWTRNDKRTESVRLDLGKWVHKDLHKVSDGIFKLVSYLRITTTMINEILRDVVLRSPTLTDEAAEASACQWLLSNRAVWEPWVPDQTRCAAGFGIQDLSGKFADSFDTAHACAMCTPGRKSVELQGTPQTPHAATFRCAHCGAGSYSSYRAQICTVCVLGTYAAKRGKHWVLSLHRGPDWGVRERDRGEPFRAVPARHLLRADRREGVHALRPRHLHVDAGLSALRARVEGPLLRAAGDGRARAVPHGNFFEAGGAVAVPELQRRPVLQRQDESDLLALRHRVLRVGGGPDRVPTSSQSASARATRICRWTVSPASRAPRA